MRITDRELDAARIALDAPSMRSRTMPRIDLRRRELDPSIEDLAWSSGERALVEIACWAWRGYGSIDMGTALVSSDQARRALTAIAVRLGLCDRGPVTLDPAEYLETDRSAQQ